MAKSKKKKEAVEVSEEEKQPVKEVQEEKDPVDNNKKDPRFASQEKKQQPEQVETQAKYVCVLGVRENEWRGNPGDEYKGYGLEDKERLEYLLGRGAVKVVEKPVQ